MADFPVVLSDVTPTVTEIMAKFINNLEAKVGIDASAVVTSLDYLLKNAASIEPGHKHSKLWASDGSPEAVTVDAAGNVGIGAPTPGAKLDVVGEFRVEQPGTGHYLRIYDDGSAHIGASSGTIYIDNRIVGAELFGGYGGIETYFYLSGNTYATAGNPLTTSGEVWFRTYAWNGSDGYTLESTSAIRSVQLDYTPGHARMDFFAGGASAVLSMLYDGNVGFGVSAFGTSADKVLSLGSGTAPTTAPADMAQMWVEDINAGAGKAGLHMMSESGAGKLIVSGCVIKATTGDPAQVHENLWCINTFDHTIKLYAEAAWKTIYPADHTLLTNIGTNTHAQIDTFIGTKAQASGLASLDAGALVVQNPANATATPTASKIPIADGSGKLDGWIASYLPTTQKGAASGVASLNASTVVVEAVGRLLAGAGALTATEGYFQWQSTRKLGLIYDGAREKAVTDLGWMPYAYSVAFNPTAAFTTALALAAAGGSIAIPIWIDGHMLLQSVSVRNTDATLARTWGWDLYEDRHNASNTLNRVAACSADESYTAGAASTRTLDAGSAPVYLGPGLYWLVIQCRHASNTFGLGSTAASGAFALNTAQTKTTTNPNGATLDFVLATWTKTTATYAVRLNGRVFAGAAAF